MPLVRLAAEGVGPFKTLDLDLSDGNGMPHLGPHILAGVNGSGKSTLLRTIAWVLDRGEGDFPYAEWEHMLAGWPVSRALAILTHPASEPVLLAAARSASADALPSANPETWVSSLLGSGPMTLFAFATTRFSDSGRQSSWWAPGPTPGVRLTYASYAPSRALNFLKHPDMAASLEDTSKGALRFENTVDNNAVQAWLLRLYSKRALARERGESTDRHTQAIEGFERAFAKVIGLPDVRFEVVLEPDLQPAVRIGGKSLNFSQLPDGVRNTLGWLADFLMRQDLEPWEPALQGKRPGVLLLDEVDAHLHPRWQRTLLPALREALPGVQIIVSTHSPFVITSCPGSRVHVLDLNEQGEAYVKESVDAPVGNSVTATLHDIFDVDSRFDVHTEEDLKAWKVLKDKANPTDRESEELARLTELLSSRNEELRLIVSTPPRLSRAVAEALSRR